MNEMLKVTDNSVEPWREIGSDWAEGLPAGWQGILKQLNTGLVILKRRDPEFQFEIGQLKEKFGALRIYYSFSHKTDDTKLKDLLSSLVDWAEWISAHTCNVCGEIATKQSRGGWVAPWCDKCWEENRSGENYTKLG